MWISSSLTSYFKTSFIWNAGRQRQAEGDQGRRERDKETLFMLKSTPQMAATARPDTGPGWTLEPGTPSLFATGVSGANTYGLSSWSFPDNVSKRQTRGKISRTWSGICVLIPMSEQWPFNLLLHQYLLRGGKITYCLSGQSKQNMCALRKSVFFLHPSCWILYRMEC